MVGPLEVIATLRKAYGPQDDWWPVDRAYHAAHGTDPRFEIIVGSLLVQNTAWANVETALRNLKDKELLDPKRLLKADPKVLQEAIRPAGFFNQKADYLRTFARHVVHHPGGLEALLREPPERLRPTLLSFRGFGEETADAVLAFAADRPVFVVDAYARRLTARLGLGTGAEPYAAVQRLWAARLVASGRAHREAHALVVEHAKRVCTARMPRCPGCPLESVCPQVGVEADVYRRLP